MKLNGLDQVTRPCLGQVPILGRATCEPAARASKGGNGKVKDIHNNSNNDNIFEFEFE